MGKTKFQKHLELLTDFKAPLDKKLNKITKEAQEHLLSESLTEEKVDELINHKNKKLDSLSIRDDHNLGSAVRLYHYSKSVEKLLKRLAQEKKVSENEILWHILSEYLNIPLEECDPSYWQEQYEKQFNNVVSANKKAKESKK